MASTRQLLLSLLILLLFLQQTVLGQTVPVPVKPEVKNNSQPLPPAPTPKPQVEQDNSEVVEEEQEQQEEIPPEEAQQVDEETDSQIPKTEQNPFNKPDIDKLIGQQFNDDMWRLLRGGLPCLETSAACLQQLQERAISQSPLLKEIDARIAEANEKVNEAKARNKKSIQLSVLTPALQYLLGPAPSAGQPQSRGLIDNIGALFRGDVGIINALLNVVGIPLFQSVQGGNADAQRNAIAIGDIQVKIAELQRGRAQLAETIREKVAVALVKFDEARTEYQALQIIASRVKDQILVYEMRYKRGISDTETYLARQNQLDSQKAQTYQAWAKMRRSLFEIKLLVLSVKDAEI